MSGVAPQQRFTRAFRCVICGGCEGDPHGQGVRCYGFLSTDGKYAHCSREEYAGRLAIEEGAGTYAHSLLGDCRCGRAHGPAVAPPLPQSTPQHPIGRPEHVYVYERAEGATAYVVLRFSNPKRFVPCRPSTTEPDPMNRLHWWTGLDGIDERVLYRLPQLLAADPAVPVFLTEGEKDADRLAGLGLVATTYFGGARGWRPEYADQLRGRHVVIVEDNDAAGRRRTAMVQRALCGIALSVQSIAFPYLPEGGDVSDWLDAGGRMGDLVAPVTRPPIAMKVGA